MIDTGVSEKDFISTDSFDELCNRRMLSSGEARFFAGLRILELLERDEGGQIFDTNRRSEST